VSERRLRELYCTAAVWVVVVVVAGGVVGATVSTGRSVERLEEWWCGGDEQSWLAKLEDHGWRNRSVGGRNKGSSTQTSQLGSISSVEGVLAVQVELRTCYQ
jgi:hypothetical protein